MRTDEDLMLDVASGEFEAFEELVRRHRRLAIGLAHNLLSDSSRAEEIAQEAFMKILRNADNYEPTASFKTYLTRIVSRLCYDRTEKNEPVSFDPLSYHDNPGHGSTPLDETLEDEERKAVADALGQLPDRQRTAIVLQTLEDFTYEEIAETMETTKKAVERLLARARKKLKEVLVEEFEFHQSELLDRDPR